MASTRPLTKPTIVMYGIGAAAFGVKDNGFASFLLLYYNQVLGLPEAWVGFGIMLALVLDGVIDPLIGYLSDHLRSPWGRRHPFMYAAALPVAASYWLLWNPPADIVPELLLAYFIVVAVLVRIFIAVYEIPSASLVPELTGEYDQRTTIFSYRFFFGWWGGLTMSVVAYAVFLQPDATHAIGVLNPVGYHHYGIIASCIMLAAILISAVGTHAYIPFLRRPSGRHHSLWGAVHELRETLTNRSFLAVFGSGIFLNMAIGMAFALNIYFNTYFWELTSTQISALLAMGFVAAVLAGVAAMPISRAMGKKPAAICLSIAAVITGPAPIVLRLIDLFPRNGSSTLFALLLVFTLVTITLFIMSSILTASMVADLVEDSEVTTGRRSEGVFVAATSFVQKTTSGIGIFASSLLLAGIGFPRGAKPGDVDPATVQMLGLAYTPIIVALYAVAIAFLMAYRISRATHEENLRLLAATTADRA